MSLFLEIVLPAKQGLSIGKRLLVGEEEVKPLVVVTRAPDTNVHTSPTHSSCMAQQKRDFIHFGDDRSKTSSRPMSQQLSEEVLVP